MNDVIKIVKFLEDSGLSLKADSRLGWSNNS